MLSKLTGVLLLLDLIWMAVGFYLLYNGGDYATAQKMVGSGAVFLFFIVIPMFLVSRYKDKRFKSFIWDPNALNHNDEEE